MKINLVLWFTGRPLEHSTCIMKLYQMKQKNLRLIFIDLEKTYNKVFRDFMENHKEERC